MTAAQNLPVVVIGAGPVGLAAAAHLAERGLEPLVLEAGDGPGSAVARWGHVRIFSPWRYDVDAAARRLLTAGDAGSGNATGAAAWTEPNPDALPTGAQLVEQYLVPLAEALTDRAGTQIRYGTRVLAVTKDGADRSRSLGRERLPYLVRLASVAADGSSTVEEVRAQAVIDASGTYLQPNPLGTSGLQALGEDESAGYLAGALPDVLGRDRDRFAGRHTLVVGMGHSAANTLLSLVELAEQDSGPDAPRTRITWAIRGGTARRLYGGGADDELPARGLLGIRLRDAVEAGRIELLTRVAIDRLEPSSDGDTVRVLGTARREGVDGALDLAVHTIAAATGFRPDLTMLREVRLDLDPVVEAPRQIASLIDPNLHSCGTVPAHGETQLRHPDAGFYLVGMKSYGRAPTFLLATGYEQVRSIAAALAGDRAAADAVELNLPQTGICSSDLALAADADGVVSPKELAASGQSSCCSVPAGPQQISIGRAPAEAAPVDTAPAAPVPAGSAGFSTGVAHGRSAD
ncbi:FAD-dependent oxidoreductase [Promicromonospora panici]|uniref:FAD-dependent oxidoreductase n=1 Tax=Promicromonospora panici TaxID=2219658 RepID=UPI00101BB131|nr:FAD-dependent oxidoreductase [Promicromonospora panici]